MAARSKAAPPPPEVEDPAVAMRRDLVAVRVLLEFLHHPTVQAVYADGQTGDDVAPVYDLAVIDCLDAIRRVACKVGF